MIKIWIMKLQDGMTFWSTNETKSTWSRNLYDLFKLIDGKEYSVRFCDSHNAAQVKW